MDDGCRGLSSPWRATPSRRPSSDYLIRGCRKGIRWSRSDLSPCAGRRDGGVARIFYVRIINATVAEAVAFLGASPEQLHAGELVCAPPFPRGSEVPVERHTVTRGPAPLAVNGGPVA
jgi:hypothetical protein